MKLNNKYLLLPVFLLFFLFLGASHALALEITKYPNIPGLITPSADCTSGCLGTYAAYWFGVLVYIAGIISLISFTIGAVTLIISADNAGLAGEGKDRMKGAILGLILTVASFIIIRTINPVLITPTLTPLPNVQGVYYIKGSERRPVASVVNGVLQEQAIKDGFTSITYDCAPGTNGQPALLIWEFSNPGLETGNNLSNDVKIVRKNCGQTEPVSGLGSFSMAFETPGVYYCLGGCSENLCQGYMSSAITASQDQISGAFNGNVGAVRIVNDLSGNYYGVIFHGTPDLKKGGICSPPIVNPSKFVANCYPIGNMNAAAADIFTVNNVNPGNGVDFYSKPNGQDSINGNLEAGFYSVTKEEINSATAQNGYFAEPMNQMCFNYKDVDVPDAYIRTCSSTDKQCGATNSYSCDNGCLEGEECDELTGICADSLTGQDLCSNNACTSFQDCQGSIDIKGHYLVGIYSQNASGKTYCQTFTDPIVPNLQVQNIVAAGTDIGAEKKNFVYIIPTQ